MTVYFVYRCHYQGPTEKHLKRFEDASVLDWFRTHWQPIADWDAAHKKAEQLLGCNVCSFGWLFMRIAEQNWAPPENEDQLRDYLTEAPLGNEISCSRNVVQVLTDDDELEMAIYFFDDHFLKKHGKRASFLLHEDWKLPSGHGEGRFRPTEDYTDLRLTRSRRGATYLVFLAFYDSGNLDELEGGYRIKGVRLPDLARCRAPLQLRAANWSHEPHEIPELWENLFPTGKKPKTQEEAFQHAIRDNPSDESNWNVYADWLEEQGLPPPGIRLLEGALTRVEPAYSRPDRNHSRDLTHVEEHLAQACLHTGGNRFHQWILFDDLWASAHPEMANAILRFARRWDVLTID
jgi:uncharacterized protein (TIGR02996 family)